MERLPESAVKTFIAFLRHEPESQGKWHSSGRHLRFRGQLAAAWEDCPCQNGAHQPEIRVTTHLGSNLFLDFVREVWSGYNHAARYQTTDGQPATVTLKDLSGLLDGLNLVLTNRPTGEYR